MLCQVGLFATPWTVALQAPWDFPGKNAGVGFHFLLHELGGEEREVAGGVGGAVVCWGWTTVPPLHIRPVRLEGERVGLLSDSDARATNVLQPHTVTRFWVSGVGGHLTPPSLPSPQRPRGVRGALGVPVRGAAGQAVACAAAAAQAPRGMRVPGVPRRRRSV